MPLVSFYTHYKHQKTFGFLMFSGGYKCGFRWFEPQNSLQRVGCSYLLLFLKSLFLFEFLSLLQQCGSIHTLSYESKIMIYNCHLNIFKSKNASLTSVNQLFILHQFILKKTRSVFTCPCLDFPTISVTDRSYF